MYFSIYIYMLFSKSKSISFLGNYGQTSTGSSNREPTVLLCSQSVLYLSSLFHDFFMSKNTTPPILSSSPEMWGAASSLKGALPPSLPHPLCAGPTPPGKGREIRKASEDLNSSPSNGPLEKGVKTSHCAERWTGMWREENFLKS